MTKMCIDCGGKMVKKIIEYEGVWGSNTVVIDAEVFKCNNCGEMVFEAKEAERILGIAKEVSDSRSV